MYRNIEVFKPVSDAQNKAYRTTFRVYKQPILWFGLVMLVMLWFGISYQIRSSFDNTEKAAHQNLKNYARVFEEHVVRTVAELDKALLIARAKFLQTYEKDGYEQAIGQRLPNPQLLSDTSFQLAMIDRDGLLRATTIGAHPPKRIDLKDRVHFQVHKTNRPDTPYISKPVLGRRSGRWSVQLTRRVSAPDGSFQGVVVASMNPAHFTDFYGAIKLIGNTTVMFAGTDGFLRVTTGAEKLKLGANIKNLPIMTSGPIKDGLRVGDLDGSGVTQLYAIKTIPGQPLFVAVGVPLSEVYSTPERDTYRFVIAGALASLLIIVAMWGGINHHRKIEKARLRIIESKAHATETAQQLGLILESMAQGLAVFGPDRQMKVVNQKFMQLLELEPDEIEKLQDIDSLVTFLEARGEYTDVEELERKRLRAQLIAAPKGQLAEYLERTRPNGTVLAIETRSMDDGGFVRTFTDITEQRQSEKRIVHLASYDHLTGLANRARFYEHLEKAYADLDEATPFALLFLDLDHFKAANDTNGHEYGDMLLRATAARLQKLARSSDLVARLGGDEFAILVHGMSNAAVMSVRANYIIEELRRPYVIDGRTTVATASIGGAMAPEDATGPEELLKNADLALYEAKAAGRNCFRAFDQDMARLVKERRELEQELSFAVARGQLEAYYQPLVDINKGTTKGFEALLRWKHSTRGLVSPVEFIAVAEESGLIVEIGEWVLHEACRQAMTWPGNVYVSVNLSPVQFHDPHLVDKVIAALDSSGLSSSRLELEITETAMLKNDEETISKLNELHAIGVRLAMDDFGTGYSSLSYLQRITFDTIKIDQSFVTDLDAHGESEAIIRSIISLARCLGSSTTAEGVETAEQLRLLSDLGCDVAQGFLFSRPQPACELMPYLDVDDADALDGGENEFCENDEALNNAVRFHKHETT